MMNDDPGWKATPARLSATVVVVRDNAAGIDVLLVQRAERGDRNSGAWVFPGGLVDAADDLPDALVAGLDEAEARRRLALPDGARRYYVAAARECFEEVGLAFVRDAAGAPVDLSPAGPAAWADERAAVHAGRLALADWLAPRGWRLDLGALHYLSHWVTPLALPKRFDTRFFVAVAPPGQQAAHDGQESVAHHWWRAADALAECEAGRAKLMGPTRATLQWLARFDRVDALLQWLAQPREVPALFPRVAQGGRGEQPIMPGDGAFAEIGRLDPEGRGNASYELEPGRPVRLSARVTRVVAHNGSVMTGPGTNSYFIEDGAGGCAVIDPGPLEDRHLAALQRHAPAPITRIFVTHTHTDHSPAAAALHAATGAPVAGRRPAHPEWQDPGFAPDVELEGGERLVLGPGATLRVIHTPGHASNHLCYLLEEEATLFTGDHVMQGSTVVINPPDGDMAAYLASLRALAADPGEALAWIAPGHGFLIDRPRLAFEKIVAHRLQREAKVREVLHAIGPAPFEAVLAQVYDDVPERMHGVAARSLRAHLIKLAREGTAQEAPQGWGVTGRG